jgi:hypothetical protein
MMTALILETQFDHVRVDFFNRNIYHNLIINNITHEIMQIQAKYFSIFFQFVECNLKKSLKVFTSKIMFAEIFMFYRFCVTE